MSFSACGSVARPTGISTYPGPRAARLRLANWLICKSRSAAQLGAHPGNREHGGDAMTDMGPIVPDKGRGPSGSLPSIVDRVWIVVWPSRVDGRQSLLSGSRQTGESDLPSAEIMRGALEVECNGMRVGLMGPYHQATLGPPRAPIGEITE